MYLPSRWRLALFPSLPQTRPHGFAAGGYHGGAITQAASRGGAYGYHGGAYGYHGGAYGYHGGVYGYHGGGYGYGVGAAAVGLGVGAAIGAAATHCGYYPYGPC